ncbi:hypothetical protein [Paraburkholderia fungorum]|uniref:hypothetical protein n=1 Tax=Paraburkholderia fungorum TaxID=134537 RepID=UPI003313D83B
MFGLYPAGAKWVRHFSSSRAPRDIQKVLTAHAGFSAGIFHQPFGESRGAVIAQKGRFLLLAERVDAACADLALVPDVQMQNLLWSFETGFASQWGSRELRALTGCDNWDALLRQASADYSFACGLVEEAVAGALEAKAAEQLAAEQLAAEKAAAAEASAASRSTADPVVGTIYANDDDVPWLPSDYLFDAPHPEVASCAH